MIYMDVCILLMVQKNFANSPVEGTVVSPIFYRLFIHQQYLITLGTHNHENGTTPQGTHGPKMQVLCALKKMGFPDQFGWIQSLGSCQSICFAGGL